MFYKFVFLQHWNWGSVLLFVGSFTIPVVYSLQTQHRSKSIDVVDFYNTIFIEQNLTRFIVMYFTNTTKRRKRANIYIWFQMAQLANLVESSRMHGQLIEEMIGKIQKENESAHLCSTKKSVCMSGRVWTGACYREQEQPNNIFWRQFWMSRYLFWSVYTRVIADSYFLWQKFRSEACGRIDIYPLLKVAYDLVQLFHGLSADPVDELFDISKNIDAFCSESFWSSCWRCLGKSYFLDHTLAKIIRIDLKFCNAGFPSWLEGLICVGWKWKVCLKNLQGIMKGKSRKLEEVMEVVCSLEIWILSFTLSLSETSNDSGIPEVSFYFSQALSEPFLFDSSKYNIDSTIFDWLHYLMNAICSTWKISTKSRSESSNWKVRSYPKNQDTIRRCIERIFDVLLKTFKLLLTAHKV